MPPCTKRGGPSDAAVIVPVATQRRQPLVRGVVDELPLDRARGDRRRLADDRRARQVVAVGAQRALAVLQAVDVTDQRERDLLDAARGVAELLGGRIRGRHHRVDQAASRLRQPRRARATRTQSRPDSPVLLLTRVYCSAFGPAPVTSFALVVGRALLGERLGAFLARRRSRTPPSRSCPGAAIASASLMCSVSRHARRIAIVDSGASGRDLLASSLATCERLALGHDLADEPDLLRLARGDRRGNATGCPSPACTGSGVGRRQAEPPSGNRPRLASHTPKIALFARDADVGALQDLGAARDRVALDRGDQRLDEAVVAQQRLPVRVVAAGHHLLHLRSSGSGPSTRGPCPSRSCRPRR